MLAIFDEDSANTVVREEQGYRAWVQDRKNQILNMVDTVKKQREWDKLFPKMVHSDDYLLGGIY